MKAFTLWQGDCLELMKNIPDGSVDLVLTDPPYGTVKNLGNSQIAKENGYRDYGWDETIDTEKMFQEIARVLRQNGKAILFSQEPYTSHIITSQIPSLPFSYRAVWVKNVFGNKFTCNKAMVNKFEDICIFTKPCQKFDFVGDNPNRLYFKKVLEYIGFNSCKQVNDVLGHRKAEHCFYVTGKGNGSTQFSICTEEVYNQLISVFGIDKMDGFEEYSCIKERNEKWIVENEKRFPRSVFNLWQGGKSKSNVLEYKKDNGGYHPTQKPVALLEDLIQTYSNEGNTVLDFTAGSMSTVIACINTNRNCIAIEKDEHYFSVGCKRVHNHILDNNIDEGYFNIAKKRIEEAVNDLP